MKKISILSIIALFFLASCNNDKAEKSIKTNEPSATKDIQKLDKTTVSWKLDQDASSVHWTGYKTTKKVAVSGTFQKFAISGVKPSTDLLKTIEGAKININVFSIFSNEESRDKKLVEYLFGHMMQTNAIEARVEKIHPDTQIVDINVNMNNHEKIVPMKLQVDAEKGLITMSGKIDLVKDFDAGEPLYFLHTACFDLHKGKDGVSKTWPEVGVKAILKFEKK